MHYLKRLLLVLVLMLAIGVSVVTYTRIKLVKSLIPRFEDVRLQHILIENGIGKANIELIIENKGNIDYKVKAIDLNLLNGSRILATYQNDSSFSFVSGKKKSYNLTFDIDTKQLLRRIKDLQNRDSTQIQIRGSLTIDLPLASYPIQINKSLLVKVPDAPDIAIPQIEYIGNRGADSLDFLIHLEVKNNNPNIVSIKNVHYTFEIKDYVSSSGELPNMLLDTSRVIQEILPLTLVSKRRMELLSKILLRADSLVYHLELGGDLQLNDQDMKKIPIRIIQHNELSTGKGGIAVPRKIQFTNRVKAERKKKRQQKREQSKAEP